MTRFKILAVLSLVLAVSQARAWDLGVDYGVQSVTLGQYYTGSSGTSSKYSSPGFDLSIPVVRYSLTDYSGELAAGISNLSGTLAAQEGAKQDAIADAERKAKQGDYSGGHGERTFELVQPVEGRTVISFAKGTATDGTYKGISGTGKIAQVDVLDVHYLRNAAGGNWESLYDTEWAVNVELYYSSYDISFQSTTGTAMPKVTRNMAGIPLGLTLAHGLGLRGLQAEVHGDFDLLLGIGYAMKLSGMSYGVGAQVSYKTMDFLTVFAAYDLRSYLVSPIKENEDKSAHLEDPTQIGAFKVGASIDLDYILGKLFTKLD